MSIKYFALLTTTGAAKLANATALGTKLNITQMAVGDGGGSLPTPDTAQIKLVNEKRRAALNALTVDEANANQIIAEQVIPESEGGFWIREIGLFDADGNLIAVANCPETYKPQLQEGSGRIQTVRMILIVSSADAVTLKIDPAVVLATRGYVDSAVIEVKGYADNVMKAHLAAADPHTQYAPKASPALTGTPTAPTAVQTTNNTQIATTAFVKAALAALVASSPAALDTLSELAAALGNDPNFATTITNALALKAPITNPTFTGAPAAPTAAAGTSTTQIATTAFVKAAVTALLTSALGGDENFSSTVANYLSLKAPLASPALTGTPTAPTAATGTSSGQVATTAFVASAIAGLINSSPAALDTLNELAAALGNDPNFATTISNALGLKAPLASPALTGTPTAPTAAAGTNTTQIATTAFVAAIAALKAPLASPALTGTPTAPTAAAGSSTTQIATTAFVASAVSALVASSPAALDTLNELAAALGNDPNFATTMTNALAAKAPLASPVLTGTPTAPTAAAAVNNTQIATTAHVKAAIAAGTAAAAGKLATPRSINGTPFDGTADIKLDFGLSLKALAQFSTEMWMQVNLTATNSSTVTITINDASRGLYVVPNQTQVVLCENAASTITVSGVSYTRFNMLGRFAIPSAPTKNSDGSTTYTITYPNHGIVVGQQKTVRLGAFVYSELGCVYQGQAGNQDGLVYHHKIVLNSAASGINVPVIGYAAASLGDWSSPGVNNAGALDAIGWDIFPRDNYGSNLTTFMSTPSLLLASTNFGTQATASRNPMVTVMVYDFA